MRRAGMTLLELVVAIAVSGVALSAGYAAFAHLLDVRREGATRAEHLVRAASVRHTLTEWVGGAHLTGERGDPAFTGLTGDLRGLPDDELAFLATAAAPYREGGTIVRLFIERDADAGRGLVAELSSPDGRERARRVEVVPEAVGLRARYLLSGGDGRRWIPGMVSGVELPVAVELTIIFPEDSTVPEILRFPLLVPVAGR